MARLSVLLALCALCAAAALPATFAAEVAGFVRLPSNIPTPPDFEVTLTDEAGRTHVAHPRQNGAFRFAAVDAGEHILEVTSLGLLFPTVSVSVTPEGEVSGVRTTPTGTSPAAYPFVLPPLSRVEYFEKRQGFNVVGFLKTPYGMMIGFMFFTLFVLPKLRPEEESQPQRTSEAVEAPPQPRPQIAASGGGGSTPNKPTRRGSRA